MKIKIQLILPIFTTFYLLVVLFTDISLVGYWTDVIFSIILVSISLVIIFKFKIKEMWLSFVLRTLAILNSVVVYGLLILNIINPFAWDILELKTFYYEIVDERLYNAYFKPVGSYSGGQGNFWITEIPKVFPIIEIDKYYNRTVDWNFKVDEFDGEIVDQNEVVKSYIKSEVIEKENNNDYFED
ncbi:MAG: hypothetical protein H6553_12265 [Chitinophagales bacterium]|nr:hypothetical protein [Chitinophagales bacterium]